MGRHVYTTGIPELENQTGTGTGTSTGTGPVPVPVGRARYVCVCKRLWEFSTTTRPRLRVTLGIGSAPSTAEGQPSTTPARHAESTGALGAVLMAALRVLARQSRLQCATDLTHYGEGRASSKRRRPSSPIQAQGILGEAV